MMMDQNRRLWNQGQQALRQAFTVNDHKKAIELFLQQHAMVHSSKMTRSELWSFENEILDDMTEEQIRCMPPNAEHSIAWVLFHLARIEDITMNILVAGTVQSFVRDNWAKKLNTPVIHSANSMEDRSVATLSAQIDIDALKTYRQTVGRRTREIVKKLRREELHQKASLSRLQTVMDEGALLPGAIEILNYWSKRTIAGLLLMPPTRHNFLHLNEGLRIKQRVQHAK